MDVELMKMPSTQPSITMHGVMGQGPEERMTQGLEQGGVKHATLRSARLKFSDSTHMCLETEQMAFCWTGSQV